ncbi:MAG: transglutaminase domain-containing protein, partial [Dehalococcoidia bacterium]
YFRVSAASNTYFSGGLPVSVSEPADGLVHPEAPEDILQVRLSDQREFFPTRVNLRYSSVGSESNATAFNLRDAGDAYPAWVSEHYLQLPTSLPDRVRELAAGITEAHDNPYDKAEAVRRYLARMPYNLNIPAPTDGRDAVDFLLFDLRQGYCDYFASAMAVMLRSLDIPARYVLGYTSGAYDNDLDEYRVLDLNYHSWVEVYFPGYGWIPFEPTPADAIEFSGPGNTPITPPEGTGQEDIGPLMEEEELDEGLAFDLPDLDIQQGLSLTIPFIIGGTVAGLLLFGGIFWYRFWLILGRLHRPDELYAKMLRLAGLVGVPRAVGQTPREYGEMLAGEVPGREEDIRTIASAYARRRYGDGAMPLS